MLAGVALAQSACTWTVLGWGREEVRVGTRALRAIVVDEIVLLGRAALALVQQLRDRLGLGHAEREDVTLGEVSEMIDIVRLGLLAGLSFDAALELYCSARQTELAWRMARAHLSWRTGLLSREEALMEAAHDLGLRPLETFAVAVGQALELGAPLSDTLLGQSREIRAAHRADVERQIERAPVKLLIPTGTLILPALLLSILGPLLAASGML